MKKGKKKWILITNCLTIVGLSLFFYQVESKPLMQSIQPTTIQQGNYELTILGPLDRINPGDFIGMGDIDQQQTKVDMGYLIGPVTNNRGWYAQAVQNDRTPCDAFSVTIGYHGNPDKKLYCGLMSPLMDPRLIPDNYQRIAWIDMSIMGHYDPDTVYWLRVDNSYTPFPGKIFSLVFVTEHVPTSEDYWFTGAGSNNPYPRQVCRSWCFQEEHWCSAITDDLCFKTYTAPDGGGDEEPAISISTNSWVVTQTMGILSIVGAVISGVKIF